MTRPPSAPPHAVAFRKSYVGYDWVLANGRFQSCPDWRQWLQRFGGEVEFEAAADVGHEPDEREFVEAMIEQGRW